jgi:hypothetical protein
MQKIPLNLAKPGMMLAKPMARENGVVIMAEGTELTDSLIYRLENMKIDHIVVKGNPVDMGSASISAQERIKRMDHLFRMHGKNVWMGKVKGFLKRYFALKASQEAAALAAEKTETEAFEENGTNGESK